jgi:hypothetical protein
MKAFSSPYSKALLIIFAFTALISCNSAQILVTHRDKGEPEEKIHNLLIVTMSGNRANRKTVEKELAYQLGKRGYKAVAAQDTKLAGVKPEKELILEIADNREADGVLLIQMLSVDTKTLYTTTDQRVNSPTSFNFMGTYMNYYATYPPNWQGVKRSDIVLETTLYQVEGEKLVLALKSQNSKVTDLEEFALSYAKAMAKKLDNSKFLEPR